MIPDETTNAGPDAPSGSRASPRGGSGVGDGDPGRADAGAAGGTSGDAAPSTGPPSGGPPSTGGSLSSGDLEQVIRRAAELQHFVGGGEGEGREGLSEEEVLRIGHEVGLEPRHVRRALAEHRAESLVPALPEDEVPLRALGEGRVRASRAVPGDPAEVQDKLEGHLRARESLQSVRRRPGRSLWEPAGSLLSKMQRVLDVGGRGYELAEARSLEVSVASLEEGWSLVTLTVDARNLRGQHAVNWMAGSAPVYFAAALVLELAAGVPWLVTGPLAGGGLLATAAAGGGWSYGKKRRRLELVLSGLLDRLEQGGPMERETPGWRERLLGEG